MSQGQQDKPDRDWMQIEGEDLDICDSLIRRQHPIKNAPKKFIFSELLFIFTCQKEKKKKKRNEYLKMMELERDFPDSFMSRHRRSTISASSSRAAQSQANLEETAQQNEEINEEVFQGEDEVDGINDPFYRFGLGVFTYMSVLRILMRYFCFMSIIAVIQMSIFYTNISQENFEMVKNEEKGLIDKFTSFFTLGSNFQAYPMCHHASLTTDSIVMKCMGDLTIEQIFDVAILDHESDLCVSNKDILKTEYTPKEMEALDEDIKKHTKCNRDSFFDKTKILEKLNKDCLNQTKCSLNNEVSNYWKKTDTECYQQSEDLDIMVQFKCGKDVKKIGYLSKQMLYCSSMGVLGGLIFIIQLSYRASRYNKIRKFKYAKYTINSKNFSCEIMFQDAHFDYICIKEDQKQTVEDNGGVSQNLEDWDKQKELILPGDEDYQVVDLHWTQILDKPAHWLQDRVVHQTEQGLKEFYGLNETNVEDWENSSGYQNLLKAIDKFDDKDSIINHIKKNHYEKESGESTQFKIIFCQFAYNHIDLFGELQIRGPMLQDLQTSENNEIDEKIQTLLEKNNEIQENHIYKPDSKSGIDQITPQAAFITFHNQFDAFLAKKMNKIIKKEKIDKDKRPQLFKHDLIIAKIGLPSDTQYENYGMGRLEQSFNIFQAIVIILIWAFFFFWGIFKLNRMLQNRNILFKPYEECKSLMDEYKGMDVLFQKNALWQYNIIRKHSGKDNLTWDLIADDSDTLNKLTGEFTCYCDFKVKNQALNEQYIMMLFQNLEKLEGACSDYDDLKGWLAKIQIIIMIFMTVCTTISQYVIMWIIKKLSFKKRSTEAKWMFLYLFVITTFQYLMIFLLNAKLDFLPVFGKFLKDGKMRDFTWEWYKEIGGVYIFKMMPMALNPIIMIVQPGPMKAVFNFLFRKVSKSKKTMWQYYTNQLGSQFLLETNMFKLGSICLLAFMFGPGIPVLFIFTLIYVLLNEISLRYQFAYHFRKPFNYSNSLIDMFIRFCATLPVINAGFGLWMYSNQQVFGNDVTPKDRKAGRVDHNHTLIGTLTSVTPGTPYLILLIISSFNLFMVVFKIKYSKMFMFFKRCKGLNRKIAALRIADTDNYFQVQKPDQLASQWNAPTYYEHFQTFMQEILHTTSVSPKLYDYYTQEMQSEEHEHTFQIRSSRFIYEWAIDPDYACQFAYPFNLINKIQPESYPDDKYQIQLRKFMNAEHAKTIFLLNYPYMSKKIRATQWLQLETHIDDLKLKQALYENDGADQENLDATTKTENIEATTNTENLEATAAKEENEEDKKPRENIGYQDIFTE